MERKELGRELGIQSRSSWSIFDMDRLFCLTRFIQGLYASKSTRDCARHTGRQRHNTWRVGQSTGAICRMPMICCVALTY